MPIETMIRLITYLMNYFCVPYKAVMHQFVAETELKTNPYLPALIDSGQLTVVRYKDYLTSDADRADYEEYFREAFERLNLFPFPEQKNVCDYVSTRENLGEIRSLYMAMKNSYPYFMSDDKGAKSFAVKYFSKKHPVDVKSLYDALVLCKEQGTTLAWKDINPTVTNAMRSQQDKVTALKSLYRQIHK